MLIKLKICGAVLAYYLSASLLYADQHIALIVQSPEKTDVEKVGAFFADHSGADKMTWAPLERDTTRFAFNIPRDGFERALKVKDGNSLFHLSSISDLGLQFHKSDMFLIGLNLATDGYLLDARHDLSEGFAVGLLVENLDEFKFGGFINKSLTYNTTFFSATLGYGSEAMGSIGGEVVQLSIDEGSELFSWMNFSVENDSGNLGFGKTWFDIQYDLDHTLVAQWDNKGWSGGLLLSKIQGDTKFSLGLVDIDQKFKPTVYADFSTPLEKLGKFSSKILVKSRDLGSQYLPQLSLKSFRRNELSRFWREAMDFNLQK